MSASDRAMARFLGTDEPTERESMADPERNLARVYETDDPIEEEPVPMTWKTSELPIEVVRHGFLYRAEGWFRTRPGSPYRAMFVHGEGRTAAWAFSAEKAGERCAKRRRDRIERDEEIWADRKSRTSTYEEK